MRQLDPHGDADRQLVLLAAVGALLDEEGFDHWLLGGWAVDFHVGEVTRTHGDVDLAVWADEANAVGSALVAAGWEHAPAADEDGGTGYERLGVRLELTFLARGEQGEVLISFRDGGALWSERPLGEHVLELAGVRARVIPLDLLLRGKASPRDDPDEADIDRADFAALSRLAL